ncbi:MAG: nicotinate-nucleotide adenylyltransferase [Pyrinomonadaceae bacterium]
MKQLSRVALYGGTFDPVHAGHLKIAQTLLELLALDEFWFVPAHVAPHKRDARVTPPLHRYAMLALATQHEARLRINTIELDAPERPYTFDTLTRLSREAEESRVSLFFVMGVDSWAEICTWREWEKLLRLINYVVITRPGYEFSAAHVTPQIRERIIDVRSMNRVEIKKIVNESAGAKIYVTDAVLMNVSATAIRDAVHKGRSAEWLPFVAPPVAAYIRKYELYKDQYETELSEQTESPAH